VELVGAAILGHRLKKVNRGLEIFSTAFVLSRPVVSMDLIVVALASVVVVHLVLLVSGEEVADHADLWEFQNVSLWDVVVDVLDEAAIAIGKEL